MDREGREGMKWEGERTGIRERYLADEGERRKKGCEMRVLIIYVSSISGCLPFSIVIFRSSDSARSLA